LIENLGYSPEQLEDVPEGAVQSAFGCGNSLSFAGVAAGDVVLDIGSGAGIDCLIAARKVGEEGKVIGGSLCHGAVVAREYKLPAVVGTVRATEAIRQGTGSGAWWCSSICPRARRCAYGLSPNYLNGSVIWRTSVRYWRRSAEKTGPRGRTGRDSRDQAAKSAANR
jgi:hypothetical protein